MNSNKSKNKFLQRATRLRALGVLAPEFHFGFRLKRGADGDRFFSLPFKRSWILIVLAGCIFAAFCIPYFTIGPLFGDMGSNDLFDLVFSLFSLFWLTGWTVGVVILGLVFLGALVGKEILIVSPGQVLLRIEILGFGVGVNYKGQAIENLRRETPDAGAGTQWRGEHLALDYGGETIGLGSDIDDSLATEIRDAIILIGIGKASAISMDEDTGTNTENLGADLVPALDDLPVVIEKTSLTSLSTKALIIVNLIPLIGVLFYGWSIGDIMLLFWAESAVVGFYNLLKMWVIGRWSILMIGPFFVGHYGGFMVVHLLFIYALFQAGIEELDPTVSEVFADFVQLWPALIGLLISHGISYRQNFLGRGEYHNRTINHQMGEPYKRIIVMHVTIIFGGFLVMAFNTPLLALILLIVLKIIVDVKAHLGEHNKHLKNSS
jgi:hypothetical protein